MIGRIQKAIAHVAWFFLRKQTTVSFVRERGTRRILCQVRILGWMVGSEVVAEPAPPTKKQ